LVFPSTSVCAEHDGAGLVERRKQMGRRPIDARAVLPSTAIARIVSLAAGVAAGAGAAATDAVTRSAVAAVAAVARWVSQDDTTRSSASALTACKVLRKVGLYARRPILSQDSQRNR
jgi:hypothetical protein